MKLRRPSYEDPAEVFLAAVEGLGEEDFELVADFVDAPSLRRFRDELLESEKALLFRETVLNTSKPAHDAGQSSIPVDIDREARNLFVQWLRWISPRAKIERLMAQGEVPQESAALWSSSRQVRLPIQLVGVVEEDARFAHVLFRVERARSATSWLQQFPEEERAGRWDQWVYGTISLSQARRQNDGTWRLVASRTFLNFDADLILSVPRISLSSELPDTKR